MSKTPSVRIELRVNARRFPHLYRFVSGAGQGEATELIRRFLETSLAEIAGTPPLSIPPDVQAAVAAPQPAPVAPATPAPAIPAPATPAPATPAPAAAPVPAPIPEAAAPTPAASDDMGALRRELAQRLRFTSGGGA